MTRINSAINVKRLTDEHLLAEHREIKRLPKVWQIRNKSKNPNKPIPEKFTLGTGHVSFFLNKFQFTLNRYFAIRAECLSRGFMVEDYSMSWSNIPMGKKLNQNYKPTKREERLLVERISTRIMESNKRWWHYYGKPISKKKAINILNNGIFQ